MNKFTKLLGIFALALFTVMWSCTGDTGPQGPVGPKGDQGAPGVNGQDGKDGKDGVDGKDGEHGQDGKDGNANVESYQFTAKADEWVEVDYAEVGTGSNVTYGVNSYHNDAITTEKFVMVYHISNDGKRDALPIYNISDMNNSIESVLFSWQSGRLDVKYRFETQLFGYQKVYAPKGDLNFEVVLVTKTISGQMKEKGVDLNDYNAVMNFLDAI